MRTGQRVLCLALLLCVLLGGTSCRSRAVNDLLGIDRTDYEAEPVIGDASQDVTVLDTVTSILASLTINSRLLPEFEDAKGSVTSYGDAILNYMFTTYYARYNGNTDLLARAADAYPTMNVTAAVPREDYEDLLYRFFNYAGTVSGGDKDRFCYLSKVDAYVPVAQAVANECVLDVITLEETEHTYRLTFYYVYGGETSPQYRAVFMKRDGADCYLKSLHRVGSARLDAVLSPTYS